MSDDLVISRNEGSVAVIEMNRPKALNALSRELLGAVADALRAADADDSIRAVVLTGSDRAFSAGADLKALDGLTIGDILDPNGFTSGFEIFNRYRKPLIAAVRGLALGGGFEIAMACDTVIAGESAQFGLPEVKVGLIPGAGGTQRLMHAVGKAKALALLLSGDTMTAAEAATAGVVGSVVPDDQCVAAAVALAARIAANGPLAVQLAKDAALASADLTLAQGIERERRNFYLVAQTEDMREGLAAFAGKRKPDFSGR